MSAVRTAVVPCTWAVDPKCLVSGERQTVSRLLKIHSPAGLSSCPSPRHQPMKGMYLSILSQFRAPHKKNSTVPELQYDAISHLREAQLLIIYEIYSQLVGPPVKLRTAMNHIKTHSNQFHIPMRGRWHQRCTPCAAFRTQHASRFSVTR